MSGDCIVISDDEDSILQSQNTSSQTRKNEDLKSWLHNKIDTDNLDPTFRRPSLTPQKRKLSGSCDDRAAKYRKSPNSHDIRKFLSQKKPSSPSSDDELPDLDRPSTSKSGEKDIGEISPVFNSSRFDDRRKRLSLSWRKKEQHYSQISGPLIKAVSPIKAGGLTRRSIEASYNAAKESQTNSASKPASQTVRNFEIKTAAAATSKQDGSIDVIAETSSEDDQEESQVLCDPIILSPNKKDGESSLSKSTPRLLIRVPSLGPNFSRLDSKDGDVNLLTESDSDDDLPIMQLATNRKRPAVNEDVNDAGEDDWEASQREDNNDLEDMEVGSETQDISKDFEADDSGSETQDESKEDIDLSDKEDPAPDPCLDSRANELESQTLDLGSPTVDLNREEFMADIADKPVTEHSSPKSKIRSTATESSENTLTATENSTTSQINPDSILKRSIPKFDCSQLIFDMNSVRSKLRPMVSQLGAGCSNSDASQAKVPGDSDSSIKVTQSKYFVAAGEKFYDNAAFCAETTRVPCDSSDEENSSFRPSRKSLNSGITNHTKSKIISDSSDDESCLSSTNKSLEPSKTNACDTVQDDPHNLPNNSAPRLNLINYDSSSAELQPILKLIDVTRTEQWRGKYKSDKDYVMSKDISAFPRSPSPIENDLDNTAITIESNDLFSGDEAPVIADSDDEEFVKQMTQRESPKNAERQDAKRPDANSIRVVTDESGVSTVNHGAMSRQLAGVTVKDVDEGTNNARKSLLEAASHVANTSEIPKERQVDLEDQGKLQPPLDDDRNNDGDKRLEKECVEQEREEDHMGSPKDNEDDLGAYNQLENFTLLEHDIVCLDDSDDDDDMFANLTQIDVAGRHDDKEREWNDDDDVILIEDDLDDELTTFDLKKVKTEMQSSWWDEDIFSQKVDDSDDFVVPDIKSEQPIVIEPNEMFLTQAFDEGEQNKAEPVMNDDNKMDASVDNMMDGDDEISDDVLCSLPLDNYEANRSNKMEDSVANSKNQTSTLTCKVTTDPHRIPDVSDKDSAWAKTTSSKPFSLFEQKKSSELSTSKLRRSIDLGSSDEEMVSGLNIYDMEGPSFNQTPKKLVMKKSKYFGRSPCTSFSQKDSPPPRITERSQASAPRIESPSQKLAKLALKKAKSPKTKLPSPKKAIMLSPMKKGRFYGGKRSDTPSISKYLIRSESNEESKDLDNQTNRKEPNKDLADFAVPEFEIVSRLSKSIVSSSTKKDAHQPWFNTKKTSASHGALPHPAGKEKKVVHLGKARSLKSGKKKNVEESFSLTQAISNARKAMASRDKKVQREDGSLETFEKDATSEDHPKRVEHHGRSVDPEKDKSRESKVASSVTNDKEKTNRSKGRTEQSSRDKSEKPISSSKSTSSSKSSTSSRSSSSKSSRSSHHSSSRRSSRDSNSAKESENKNSSKSESDNNHQKDKILKDNINQKDKSDKPSDAKTQDKRLKDSEKSTNDSKEKKVSKDSERKSSRSSSSSSRSSNSRSRTQSGRSDKDALRSRDKSDSKSSRHPSDGKKEGQSRAKVAIKVRDKVKDKVREDMSLLSQIIHDQDTLMTADPEMEKHVGAPPKKDAEQVKTGAKDVIIGHDKSKTANSASNEAIANTLDKSLEASSSSGAPTNEFIKSLRATIAKSQSTVSTSSAAPAVPSSSNQSSLLPPRMARNVGSDGFAVPLPTGPVSRIQNPRIQNPGAPPPTNIRGRPSHANMGGNVRKDRQPIPSVSLSEDNILRMILRWNPAWLQEQVKFGAKSKPPPILDVVRCKELYGDQPPTLFPLLTHGYESLKDYFKIMLPLMLHEVWAQIFNQYCERMKRKGLCSFEAILCQLLDRNEHTCEVMFQTIITEEQFRERKRPTEGTLVIAKLSNGGKENGSQTNNLQLLALTTRAERSQRSHPFLANHPQSKVKGSSIWNVALKFAPRKLIKFEDNQTVVLKCLDSIVTTHRHIRALLNLNQVPSCICRAFLRPTADRKAFFHQPPLVSKMQLAKGQYNASQSHVISAVSSAILESYITPKICLIQGPPGTGKSHTILGIIKETLRGTPVDGGKVHILLTAPSNAAVDELVKKLVKDDEKAQRTGHQRRVNFIRMGTQSHPAVQEFSLERKAQRLCAEKFRQQNLPLSIQEELKQLESALQEIEMRKRAARQANRNSEVVNCEREERNTRKKKDQIEAAYQTSGKQQLTFKERKDIEMKLLMSSDVICTTLNSCGLKVLLDLNGRNPRYPFFNAVIVDEACQSTEIDNLIPFQFKCTKLVLVGDPRQLPATVISKVAENLDYNQSLFERLEKSFSSDQPVMMLDTQYRMHPDICHFPSNHIYEGRLKTDLITASQRETSPYVPYKVFDLIDGQEIASDFGFWNPTELDFVCALCSFLMKGKPESYVQAIGIISPYRAQSTKLLRALRERNMAIEAATVDGFQGREKDIIIVTCVRAKSDSGGIGFLSDVRRMNVALTRARYACYVVGHLQSLKVNRDWRYLISDAEERKMVTRVSRKMNTQEILHQEIMKKKMK